MTGLGTASLGTPGIGAPSLLPPNASAFERATEASMMLAFGIPVDVARLWNPATCPAALLPWLAWGLSVDLWDADWPEATKRAAIADAIPFQRRKGTRASLRTVLDRFDPLIRIVEWFEANPIGLPHTFRLELPLSDESAVIYDEALVAALLRDIAAVKPVRSHMQAVHRLVMRTSAYLLSAAQPLSYVRLDCVADVSGLPDSSPLLATEDYQLLLAEDDSALEVN